LVRDVSQLARVPLESGNEIDGIEPGAPITVCIRPEDLQLGEPERKTANMARARIEHLEFLGAYYRATLTIEGIAERVPADFSPTLLRDQAIRDGGEVFVSFPEDRMQVFPQPQTQRPVVQELLEAPVREPSLGRFASGWRPPASGRAPRRPVLRHPAAGRARHGAGSGLRLWPAESVAARKPGGCDRSHTPR
jgi:hypothetical protein